MLDLLEHPLHHLDAPDYFFLLLLQHIPLDRMQLLDQTAIVHLHYLLQYAFFVGILLFEVLAGGETVFVLSIREYYSFGDGMFGFGVEVDRISVDVDGVE